ncbi:TonB-dependent receptor [Microbulbifer aggregans]|uniref:TonB-dependent receptor n=1 Tax=Microbulbifer aggregans TaxID=1769779 RepID=UPI001CFEFCC9|nr:TonB-dependent receptor [Microbulbifer aggregans]
MTYKKQILAVAIAMAASASLVAQEAETEAKIQQAEAQQTEQAVAEENPSSFAIEEVYVEGVKSAELNARQAERDKSVFSSVITQDDSGNFADQNVAESLQRLPGITLQSSEGEGKFINLRGLGPGFVSVQMNGSEMANSGGGPADSESRGFSLDALPADVLQSIEVLKSLTPDMDLNSIGGSVNVTTISALDRGENTIKLRAQGAFQEQSGETSPKLTLQGTNIFADETIGFSYSLSYENRVTEGYESRAHDSSLPRYISVAGVDETMLIPFELQNRQENAERERIAGIFDLEYRPNDNSKYYARYSNTVYTDEDVAMREYYRWGQADDDEVVYLDPATNTFGSAGIDLQHQYFMQESESDTKVFALGGENLFGNNYTLDYELTHSNATQDTPDSRRVQFRVRDITALGRTGEDFLNGQIVHPEQLATLAGLESLTGGNVGANGYLVGEQVQANMLYDNLFMEQSSREDTIDQVSLNLRRDFDMGPVNFVKTGFKIKNRERNRDKNRISVDPRDKYFYGCDGDEACEDAARSSLGYYETFIPDNDLFDHAFISEAAAEQLIAATRKIGDNYDPEERELESTRNDYDITEDTAAAYVMGEFQVTETGALIAGVRYEQTDFNSTGYLSIRNDREESADQLESFDIAVPLDDTSNSYSGFFPSLHYRDELRDDLLLRASLWTSFSRPSFDEARAYAQVRDRVEFCNFDPAAGLEPGKECSDQPADLQGAIAEADYTDEYKAQNLTMSSENILEIGNPKLDPMTATNFDVSLGWYANENLFIQAAAFYKQIDDFIVEVSGADLNLADLPYTLPVDQVTMFNIPADLQLNNAQTYLNGEGADVYGLEVTYNQYFTQGLLANFFIQSNFTLLHSEADVGDSVRADKIRLPEQADVTVNTTLGWENDDFSVRFITNYRSEILKRIGSCTDTDIAADAALGYSQNCNAWADVYQDAGVTYDIKATYNVNDSIKLYFDAVNITDESNIQYFDGNAASNGHMMFLRETYGPTYQLGMNVQF